MDGGGVAPVCVQYCPSEGAVPARAAAVPPEPEEIGYQLFFNGKLVSNPDAASYTPEQAIANCARNQKTQIGINVECRYNGELLEGDLSDESGEPPQQ
jgi:hypothetical protein